MFGWKQMSHTVRTTKLNLFTTKIIANQPPTVDAFKSLQFAIIHHNIPTHFQVYRVWVVSNIQVSYHNKSVQIEFSEGTNYGRRLICYIPDYQITGHQDFSGLKLVKWLFRDSGCLSLLPRKMVIGSVTSKWRQFYSYFLGKCQKWESKCNEVSIWQECDSTS